MQKKSNLKNKYIDLEHASKLHKKLQSILLQGTFLNIPAFQEVEIRNLVDTKDILYIDWYIPSMRLCIELHGIQHYKPIAFTKQSRTKTLLDFNSSKNRDLTKKQLLEDNNYIFIEIPYKDYNLISEEYLLNKIGMKYE